MLSSLLKLAIGLIGIGFVVIIHELGHLIAARACGITVEIFSLGMGPKLAGWKVGDTEIRISALLIGGYCRMKGADDLARAIATHSPTFDNAEYGSLFAAPPYKRMITYAAGPFSSFLAAILIFACLLAVPRRMETTPSRIVTVNQYPELFFPSNSSAFDAGLRSGDLVTKFDDTDIKDWQQLETLLKNAQEGSHAFTVARNGKELVVRASSDVDGRWGIACEVDPVVGYVQSESVEARAGLREGDRIVMACGQPIANSLDLLQAIATATTIRLEAIGRDGHKSVVFPAQGDGVYHFSIATDYTTTQGKFSLLQGTKSALNQLGEMWRTIHSMLKGERRDIAEELTGMGKAASLIGSITLEGMGQHPEVGFKGFWYLIAIVSLSLAISNALPLPSFDGSQIVMALWEQITRRRISPKIWWTIQFVGWVSIGTVMLLMSLGDMIR